MTTSETTTAQQPDTATTEHGNPMPPWWGWPGGHWRPELPGSVGPNGFSVIMKTDLVLHRGIHAGDRVWVNPDKPAQPGEVVLAALPDGRHFLAVWDSTGTSIESLRADGPPPWGDAFLAGYGSGQGGPKTFTVVGPAVWVELATRNQQPVPAHAPLSTGWTEPWARWHPAWTYAGQTSARVEMAGLDGEPYVLSLSAATAGGSRLYLPARDQERTRQLVETARRTAWADLRPLRPESHPAEAPTGGTP
jgi:hypothetical protein